MKSLIRYRTKPDSADKNQRLVDKVYAGVCEVVGCRR